ncbi:hypothetical protein ACWD6R_37185 [Streptomyces sp. NPDC005151]
MLIHDDLVVGGLSKSGQLYGRVSGLEFSGIRDDAGARTAVLRPAFRGRPYLLVAVPEVEIQKVDLDIPTAVRPARFYRAINVCSRERRPYGAWGRRTPAAGWRKAPGSRSCEAPTQARPWKIPVRLPELGKIAAGRAGGSEE